MRRDGCAGAGVQLGRVAFQLFADLRLQLLALGPQLFESFSDGLDHGFLALVIRLHKPNGTNMERLRESRVIICDSQCVAAYRRNTDGRIRDRVKVRRSTSAPQ